MIIGQEEIKKAKATACICIPHLSHHILTSSPSVCCLSSPPSPGFPGFLTPGATAVSTNAQSILSVSFFFSFHLQWAALVYLRHPCCALWGLRCFIFMITSLSTCFYVLTQRAVPGASEGMHFAKMAGSILSTLEIWGIRHPLWKLNARTRHGICPIHGSFLIPRSRRGTCPGVYVDDKHKKPTKNHTKSTDKHARAYPARKSLPRNGSYSTEPTPYSRTLYFRPMDNVENGEGAANGPRTTYNVQ
jgi:hypothetical protein